MRRRATTQGRPRRVPLPIESAAASWRHAPRQAFRTDPEQHGIVPVTIPSADQTSLPIGTVCVSERPEVGHRCPPASYLPPSPIHALLRRRVHFRHPGIFHPALGQGALGSSTSPGVLAWNREEENRATMELAVLTPQSRQLSASS